MDFEGGGRAPLRPPTPPGEFPGKLRWLFLNPPTLRPARLAGKHAIIFFNTHPPSAGPEHCGKRFGTGQRHCFRHPPSLCGPTKMRNAICAEQFISAPPHSPTAAPPPPPCGIRSFVGGSSSSPPSSVVVVVARLCAPPPMGRPQFVVVVVVHRRSSSFVVVRRRWAFRCSSRPPLHGASPVRRRLCRRRHRRRRRRRLCSSRSRGSPWGGVEISVRILPLGPHWGDLGCPLGRLGRCEGPKAEHAC